MPPFPAHPYFATISIQGSGVVGQDASEGVESATSEGVVAEAASEAEEDILSKLRKMDGYKLTRKIANAMSVT